MNKPICPCGPQAVAGTQFTKVGRDPVYRSTTTGDFLYLYDWGKGLGMNWFISLEVLKPNTLPGIIDLPVNKKQF